ncbi:hypothetical protein ILYODFUR_034790 [Ilyodon furcidens]|uniref:Secreted protein n=1 Tax=Ilyodon furcidens TaxID=33524 RepID=A0ABV0ULJ0_9TELE
MVVGGVVHRGVCLSAWLALGVSVHLPMGVHVPMLACSLHLGGPAILGRVFLLGDLGVGVGCVLLPRLPGCGCCPVSGIGDWAFCWLKGVVAPRLTLFPTCFPF